MRKPQKQQWGEQRLQVTIFSTNEMKTNRFWLELLLVLKNGSATITEKENPNR